MYKELKTSRNFKSGFEYGIWFGLMHGYLVNYTKGKEPWTFRHRKRDCDTTKPKD